MEQIKIISAELSDNVWIINHQKSDGSIGIEKWNCKISFEKVWQHRDILNNYLPQSKKVMMNGYQIEIRYDVIGRMLVSGGGETIHHKAGSLTEKQAIKSYYQNCIDKNTRIRG